ncbi:PrsW family intramembrane metalloprotease [Sorangium sp. So ce131]|uniref:PrsW family intramembrane metalloprotease n=1 Tax=Sorangium sp. So ce131 TaxID=3133282 RepID=UPI003F607071
MNAAAVLIWLATVAAPIGALSAALVASRRLYGRRRFAIGTALLGALAYLPALLLEGFLQRWQGLDKNAATLDAITLVYLFVVAAPLEQGLKVAAVAPIARLRAMDEPFDGLVYAAAAAFGFVSAHNAVYLWGRPLPSFDIVRALLAVPAHMVFASLWGYALGRERERKRPLGGRRFNAAWMGAMLLNGAYDYIVFACRPVALLVAAPMLLGVGFVAFLAARDLLRRGASPQSSRRRERRFLPQLGPPSLGSVREALRRTERPVTLSWIVFGALVTVGVMTTTLALAVALGHRFGVDFAAVDRGDASAAAAAPLLLLVAAAIAAFPLAGYLVARASSTGSVLEPAASAALAILGSLVLLGLAAPVAVVFATALAPIAFSLACAGAWIGTTR